MQKIQKFHHSVTENGKLQVRILTEYQDDNGDIIEKKYSDAMTPVDVSKMSEWDTKSQDIVSAITEPQTISELSSESQTLTGIGLEEIVTYDRVVEEDGKIAVRRITRIFDDGIKVSKKFHRSWIVPGDDVATKDVISKAVATKLHVQDVIDTYEAKQVDLNKIV